MYLESLLTLFGPQTKIGFEVKMRGELRFERPSPQAPYTSFVFIRHYRIGSLSPSEAHGLRLSCQLASGPLAPLTVQLLVEGGRHGPAGGEAGYRVRIDAARPFSLV